MPSAPQSPSPPLQVDMALVVRALQAEVERLNRVLDNVPLDVRLRAEEAAVHVPCPRCSDSVPSHA